MDLSEFNKESRIRKAALVWEQGQFMAIRVTEKHNVVLYHMGSFFAEVWYDPDQVNISFIRGFNRSNCLESYLNLIELTQLDQGYLNKGDGQ
jgi:hypothetical protein